MEYSLFSESGDNNINTHSNFSFLEDSFNRPVSYWDSVYSEIKMKMFNNQRDVLTELPEEKVDSIKKEYSTENLEKVILNFKKKISILYLKKKEVANKYSVNKNKYSAFMEGINDLILKMDNIEPDPVLKELLIKKIDEYYSLLDLKNTKE